MAHELPAAGYGFLWPKLTFESDGESVVVLSEPTDSTSRDPVRYLERFAFSLKLPIFEAAVSDFINLVVARLRAVGIKESELHHIWREATEERDDQETSLFRRLEAGLGFDPDEAPQRLLETLRAISKDAGEAATFEIVPALSKTASELLVLNLQELAGSEGLAGEVEPPPPLLALVGDATYQKYPVWERGWLLARGARSVWGLHLEPLSNITFSDILNADISKPSYGIHDKLPLGLAVRNRPGSARLNFHFRRTNSTGRRFEAARLLADHLLAPSKDRWLPETDAKTARQKIQRAFAAEFLCPIDGLKNFLNDDFSNDAIEDAGRHFDVSPLLVRSHLANNGVISPDAVVD